MSDAVLVTGAFGLVGSATVTKLAADGRRVLATDIDTPQNRKAAGKLPGSVEVRWTDLTDAAAVDALVDSTSPTAIIHLAAVIPPLCYARRELARRVNVDGTGNLLQAAAKQPASPRFVQASSIAVYGARNPHRSNDVLTAETPVHPSDNYGAHKVEAEHMVRNSGLDWLILRLGGVMFTEPRLDMDRDMIYFEGLLPTDARLQTVDVRDVAAAFAAATTTPVTGEVLLIGGDESHRLTQGDVGPAMAAAMGLAGGLPSGRRGDPNSAATWFSTDWMDTSRSQEVLDYQHHSWPDMLTEASARAGWKRYLLRLAAPLVRRYLQRRSPYRNHPGRYADPWPTIQSKWGDPAPDRRHPETHSDEGANAT